MRGSNLPTRGSRLLSERIDLGDRFVRVNRGLIAETGIIPNGLQLIQDTYPFEIVDQKQTVTEDAHGREIPVMRVMGLIQHGDKENANGRHYSTRDVLAPAVQNIQEDISNRAVMGEFDHPPDAKIHLDRISHLMTKVWMDGRKMYGEAEVLHKVPHGAALRGLFEHKVRIGISSRGVGDMEMVEHGGHQVYNVLPGYAFVTWDTVAEPSVNGAILNIQESLTRRLRPIKQQRHLFSPEKYQGMLVEEINNFFNIKPKKTTIPMRSPRR